jgi:hypothetical protein
MFNPAHLLSPGKSFASNPHHTASRLMASFTVALDGTYLENGQTSITTKMSTVLQLAQLAHKFLWRFVKVWMRSFTKMDVIP